LAGLSLILIYNQGLLKRPRACVMNTDISVRFVMCLLYPHLTGKFIYLQVESAATSIGREPSAKAMKVLKAMLCS
ncbi:hypothetical protein, partial [Oscillatoria sp. HE19RPO]|uniref:hypothetical protein n=1 Tax=Oscillatoria sp. HE19RPO TaxID=2954806 RepID=UPI0020C58702